MYKIDRNGFQGIGYSCSVNKRTGNLKIRERINFIQSNPDTWGPDGMLVQFQFKGKYIQGSGKANVFTQVQGKKKIHYSSLLAIRQKSSLLVQEVSRHLKFCLDLAYIRTALISGEKKICFTQSTNLLTPSKVTLT